MEITRVSVRTAPFSQNTWLDESRIANPLSWSARFVARRSSWRGPGSDVVWVYLETDDPEIYGVGQSRGGTVTAELIRSHFADLVVGREATAIAERTTELRLAAFPYADGGVSAMAVSAIELALWDLTARAARIPLVDLLGGRGSTLRYYLTVPRVDLLEGADPHLLERAEAIKLPAPYGPSAGWRGLDTMLGELAEARDRVPAEVPLAVDCFMSWDVDYTVRFAKRADNLGLRWIEEPLMPRDFAGYVQLARLLSPVSVAGGEHLFSLADAAEFMRLRCARFIQVDVTWCGGIGVASTVARLAAESDIVFAPHAAGLQPWAVHLAAASGPHTLIEVLLGVDRTASVPVPGNTPGVGISPSSIGFH